jgi:hypothetical protein
VLDASTGKRQKYFVIWRHLNCSSANYTTHMEHKICVLPTKLHNGNAFHENWIRLHIENVYVRFHTSVNNVFATRHFQHYQLHDYSVDGGQWGVGEDTRP